MRRDIAELYSILDYSFKNVSLLRNALTHRSMGNDNNERIEFLGDSILNFVIAAELFERYPLGSEGELSRIRASLVNKDTLAELGTELCLGDFLVLGAGELKSGGFRRASIVADAVEAILGAVYLDSGFAICRELILRLYQPFLSDSIDAGSLKDPKTRLQELLQSRKQALPAYDLVEVTGKPHSQVFKISCSVQGLQELALGTGSSRRKAEQEAAAKALHMLAEHTSMA